MSLSRDGESKKELSAVSLIMNIGALNGGLNKTHKSYYHGATAIPAITRDMASDDRHSSTILGWYTLC